ncbi:MAG: glycosyltransferase family 4 protein [bacterium]
MNIGMVTDSFLPIIGGAEIHINKLSKFLVQAGHKVEIYTLNPGDNAVEGISVIRNQRPENYLKYRVWYFIPYLIKNIVFLYRFSKNKQILHCHYTSYLTAVTVCIGRLFRIPVVVTLHGAGTLDSSTRRSRFGNGYRYLSFKLAKYIISTSQEMADIASQYVNRNNIVVIPNGVDTQEFIPSAKEMTSDKLIVTTTRRLVPKNGVQYLIEAIPLIIRKIAAVEFVIIGTGTIESYLKQRVKELGIEAYVRFISKIDNQDMKKYLATADIVVFPSSAESTSISCLEAMAMEKGIIASAVGAYPDILGNNDRGILVPLFDSQTSTYEAPLTLPPEKTKLLAETVITLGLDQSRREQLGKVAREYVLMNYDWRNLTQRIIEIYQRIGKT